MSKFPLAWHKQGLENAVRHRSEERPGAAVRCWDTEAGRMAYGRDYGSMTPARATQTGKATQL